MKALNETAWRRASLLAAKGMLDSLYLLYEAGYEIPHALVLAGIVQTPQETQSELYNLGLVETPVTAADTARAALVAIGIEAVAARQSITEITSSDILLAAERIEFAIDDLEKQVQDDWWQRQQGQAGLARHEAFERNCQ